MVFTIETKETKGNKVTTKKLNFRTNTTKKSRHQSGFVETPLVQQAVGELRNRLSAHCTVSRMTYLKNAHPIVGCSN